MASVTFKRTNNIDSVPITNGQLIFDTSDQKIYLDNGNTREVYGGGSGTDLISNVSDATDNNAFNANATVNLFTRKSSIVDTKAEIQSVTQAGVPLGCKGFNEVIGTGDISALGDGSVTGAILANKSAIDTVNQNLTKWNSTTRTLWAYVDGAWQDTKIRGYIGSIPIYVSGVFEEQCDNGTHHATQASSAPSPFVESNSKLTTPNIGNYTLTTSNSIDLTNYSKLKVVNNGVTKEVNIGSVSGQQYVYVYVNNTSANAYLEFGITSTLTWPVEASHRIVFGSATYASIADIQISEIAIE